MFFGKLLLQTHPNFFDEDFMLLLCMPMYHMNTLYVEYCPPNNG